MVDAILNTGMPAPIDIQVSSPNIPMTYRLAVRLPRRYPPLPETGQIYIPQDMDYPGIRMDVDRVHAAELGLTQKDVVDNVITALNSDVMIAPNYWVDRKTGNNYFLTVQYYEHGTAVDSRSARSYATSRCGRRVCSTPTTLDTVVNLRRIQTPTEIDHYQIQRVGRRLCDAEGRGSGADYHARSGHCGGSATSRIFASTCVAWSTGWGVFQEFRIRIWISFLLLYLILVAQFNSFVDPLLIMLAIPMGVSGVLFILLFTETTLNVMSLMGVLMLVGIANSNSILIVDFAHRLEEQGIR